MKNETYIQSLMKKNAQDVKDVLILVLLYILFPQIIRNSQEFLQAGPKTENNVKEVPQEDYLS